MITLRYDTINEDGSDPYNLMVYFSPEESACPYPVIIEDWVARAKFVREFEKMIERCQRLDRIANEFDMMCSEHDGKYVRKSKPVKYCSPLFRFDEEFPETLSEDDQ